MRKSRRPIQGRPLMYNQYQLGEETMVSVPISLETFEQKVKRLRQTLIYNGVCPFCESPDPNRHGVHWNGAAWIKCPIGIGEVNNKRITYFKVRWNSSNRRMIREKNTN